MTWRTEKDFARGPLRRKRNGEIGRMLFKWQITIPSILTIGRTLPLNLPIQPTMNEEELTKRIERFERSVATSLCALPGLFALQCVMATLSCPVFARLYKDNHAKLPALTDFVFRTWWLWALFSISVLVTAVVISRRGKAGFSAIFSTASGLGSFVLAQVILLAIGYPIFQLSAAVGGP